MGDQLVQEVCIVILHNTSSLFCLAWVFICSWSSFNLQLGAKLMVSNSVTLLVMPSTIVSLYLLDGPYSSSAWPAWAASPGFAGHITEAGPVISHMQHSLYLFCTAPSISSISICFLTLVSLSCCSNMWFSNLASSCWVCNWF